MKRFVYVLFAVTLLAVGLVRPASTEATNGDSSLVVVTTGTHPDPMTNGEVIVFGQSSATNPDEMDIHGIRLSDGQSFPIVTRPGSQFLGGISGDIVVWYERSEDHQNPVVRGKDLSTGQEFTIAASNTTSALSPLISGDWVVWYHYEQQHGESLRARNLATQVEHIVLPNIEPGTGVQAAIDGDHIVVREWRGVETGPDRYQDQTRLFSLRLGDAQPTVIAEATGVYQMEKGWDTIALSRLSGSIVSSFDVDGDTVAYIEDTFRADESYSSRQLIIVDQATGERVTIQGSPVNVAIDGRYVIWEDNLGGRTYNPLHTEDSDIFAYDLATGRAFPISTGAGADYGVDVSGGLIVWQRTVPFNEEQARRGEFFTEIHAARVAVRLPIAPRSDPGTTSDDWTYFLETGHFIAHGFRAYWERNGGLPVFGYPLTEEFTEHGLTVQYFERQRFEYHPEHADTPYEVELGRLGAEVAEQRGLLIEPAFVRGPIPSLAPEIAPRCRFFNETGFLVCDDFYRYWQEHGLDLGEPETSFRESVALFGYPISQAYVDPATGLTVQWFERARFEYHPNNPDPFKVLLGRLGAELLSQHDWE